MTSRRPDALGVVGGHVEDQIAVGEAEDQVLALLTEGDLGLPLLDDGGPVVGVDDFVSDLEGHRTQGSLLGGSAAPARARRTAAMLCGGGRDGSGPVRR